MVRLWRCSYQRVEGLSGGKLKQYRRDKLGRKPIEIVAFHVDGERMGGERKIIEEAVSQSMKAVVRRTIAESAGSKYRRVLKTRDIIFITAIEPNIFGCAIEYRTCSDRDWSFVWRGER